MQKKTAVAFALLVALPGLACRKSEPSPTPPPVTAPPTTEPAPVTVSLVTLGTALGADKRVTAPSESFKPKDAIYASVESTGTGHAKLRALWTFVKGEKTAKVDETTIEYDATGPTTNEFHVSKPSGWPKGDYRLDIFLNDAPTPSVTKGFKVG